MSSLEENLQRAQSDELFDRVRAAERLGEYDPQQHEAVRETLLKLFQDQAAEVRQLAFYSLAQWQKDDLEMYQKAAQDEAYLVRTAAAEMLGTISNNSAASEILITLLKDPYYSVRATAAEALGQQEAFLALPALQDALLDSDQWVRYSAAESLNQIESDNEIWPHVMALHSTGGQESHEQAEALRQLSESNDRRVIPTLLFLFKQDMSLQQDILDTLTTFHDYLVIPALIDIALFTEKPHLRETALIAAQTLSIPETLRALEHWLDPDYLEYAQRAVELLARLPMPKQVRPLLKQALNLPDQWIRTVALNALEKQGAAADLEVLTVLTKDPSPDLATTALINLSRHYPDQLPRHAKAFVQSHTPWKEEAVALALRYAPQEWVVQYAPLLIKSPHANTRESLCKSLRYHGSSAQPLLLRALNDDEHWVRQEAIDSLGAIVHPEATKALIHHLLHDEDFMVRAVAAQALEKHLKPNRSESEATRALRKALNDSSASVRLQAVRSLIARKRPDLKDIEQWFKIPDKAIQLALMAYLQRSEDPTLLPCESPVYAQLETHAQSNDLQLAAAAQQVLIRCEHKAPTNPVGQ